MFPKAPEPVCPALPPAGFLYCVGNSSLNWPAEGRAAFRVEQGTETDGGLHLRTRTHRLRQWLGDLIAPAPSHPSIAEMTEPTPPVIAELPEPMPEPVCATVAPVATEAEASPADPEPRAYQARAWTQAGGLPEPLKQMPPRQHALELLAWMAEATSNECTFADVREAYNDMCCELWIEPHTWVCVARHFTPLTGGKRYRSAIDPRTGLREARERVYTIPAAADLNKPVRPVARPAVRLVQPVRRAA